MKTDFLIYFENKPLVLFIGLLVIHSIISLSFYSLATSSILTGLHNGEGLWNFALDSKAYHEEAKRLLVFLQSGDYQSWWQGNKLWVHVKYIALTYWILGEYPIAYELVNGPVWAMTVIAIGYTGRVCFKDSSPIVSYLPAIIIGFLPSFLLSTTQLLREPVYILGWSLISLGWMLLFKNTNQKKSMLFLIVGFLFVIVNRPYLSGILQFIFILSLFSLSLSNRRFRSITVFVGIVLLFFSVKLLNLSHWYELVQTAWVPSQEVQKAEKIAGIKNVGEKKDRYKQSLINDSINKYISTLMHARNTFITSNQNDESDSNIDINIKFTTVSQMIYYLPRAFQIGFFSPFPTHWFESGGQVGRVGRLLSGVETLLWYCILIGFLSGFRKNFISYIAFGPILVSSVVIILMLGFVVTNIGTIYRMRFGLMIPFYILGVHGLYSIYLARSK